MYCPAHFQAQDPQQLQTLMAEYPLATIVSSGAQGLVADHIPLLYEAVPGKAGRLLGHVAKANQLWQTTAPVLVVFQGPDAYVSPSWYASKQTDGKVVPTWNYAVVHVQANLRAVHEKETLLQLVSRLTETHESGMPSPWQVADAPPEYTEQLLSQIVGIELDILSMQGKFKLSQNQSAQNRQGVLAALQAAGAGEMAGWMSVSGA